MTDMCDTFRTLHQEGTFVLPNPWDLGSARILESLGFSALATTSSGLAATKGRFDQTMSFDELLHHAEEVVAGIGVPLNLDSERCFADDLAGIEANVVRMAETGAAGFSIEDYNPETGAIDPVEVAVDRVAAAAAGASRTGMVLTARTENHLYGQDDLDDTIGRLVAFGQAGAEAVYAPGLIDPEDIRRVVAEVGLPVNVLALPKGPSVPELTDLGVRRVSTGGTLARAAHGALVRAGRELLGPGTETFAADGITQAELSAAFPPPS